MFMPDATCRLKGGTGTRNMAYYQKSLKKTTEHSSSFIGGSIKFSIPKNAMYFTAAKAAGVT